MSIEVVAPVSRTKTIAVRIETAQWQEYLLY
jgi:hypothetical protein